MLPILYLCRLPLEEPRRRQRPDARVIEMCDNWLRVDRIELTVFVITRQQLRSIKNLALRLKGPVEVRAA